MGQRPTESHGCMKWKICAGYKQEGIDLSSSEKPSNYGKTQFLAVKGRKNVWVCRARGETPKIRYPQKGAWILNVQL